MSFRKELKSVLVKSKYNILLSWIFKNNGKVLYPPRIINSVYFDNANSDMYFQSIEGTLPRKKIRLRIYDRTNFIGNFFKNANLEYKISSVEGRFKIVKKKNSNSQKLYIDDSSYGKCYPKINILYERSYFIIKNFRLTIDRDINYRKVILNRINPHIIKDKLNVVEIKYSNLNLDTQIFDTFPFQFNRFSKYCRGVEFINKKICDEII